MKINNTMQEHKAVCDRLSEFYRKRGDNIETEVELPIGRGAVDVVVFGRNRIRYFEVKSHPTSLNQRGLQKQFNRYEETFPGHEYYLAFPIDSRRLMISNYKTKQKKEIEA
jgi:hypothetical protein